MKKTQYLLLPLLFLPMLLGMKNPTLQTEKRIALVIGNGGYTHHTRLKNPTNDADKMKETLEALGFEVIKRKNLNHEEMTEALDAFYTKIERLNQQGYKVVTLLYYSGHGMQVEHVNYLIPIKAQIRCPKNLKFRTINLAEIIEQLDAYTTFLNVVMIDACRSNNFTKQKLKKCLQNQNPDKNITDDLFDGLAETSGNMARSNMCISYATAPYENADSGDKYGKYSPYVKAFVEKVKKPNIPIQLLFTTHLSKTVKQITKNAQRPWYNGSFDGDFMFKKAQPLKDTDGDGYADTVDKCPSDYSTTNNGCPPPPPIPNMVYVKGGSFMMGSSSSKYDDEKPVHQVNVPSFYISKYEVTNAEYCAFLNAKGNQIEGGGTWLDIESNYCKIEKSGSRFVPKSGYGNHPVINVSWYGARAYCKWNGGNLPTESEWEYAARGGNKSKNYTYSGSNTIDKVAWHDLNSDGKTHSVGTKQANELGLYDMSGNVYEWCLDTWHSNYKDAPINGTAWIDEKSNYMRVLRGGSWDNNPNYCRVAYRDRSSANYRSDGVGFRVVRH